jgi:uncharacterized OsmC-like protein
LKQSGPRGDIAWKRAGSIDCLDSCTARPHATTKEQVMTNTDRIKRHAEDTARALAVDPAQGQSSGSTKVRLNDALTCEIEDGPWRLTADLPAKVGGGGRGPDPGTFIRGALGSCLAMDIVTWAARLGVPLDGVEVDVRSTLDARGMYGVDDRVPPGYQSVHCRITVESPAPEAAIRRVVRMAEALNARLYDLTHAIPVARELVIADSAHGDTGAATDRAA